MHRHATRTSFARFQSYLPTVKPFCCLSTGDVTHPLLLICAAHDGSWVGPGNEANTCEIADSILTRNLLKREHNEIHTLLT